VSVPASAPGAARKGVAGASAGGKGSSGSKTLAAHYAPVIAALTADRPEQMRRVSAMMEKIAEARDAEILAAQGDFELSPDHPGAEALDQESKPLIAILLAKREQQFELVKRLQMQVREARDIEIMYEHGTGSPMPGRPALLVSPASAALLSPKGRLPGSRDTPAPDDGEDDE